MINANYLNTWGRPTFHEDSSHPAPKPTGTYLTPGSIATVTVPAGQTSAVFTVVVNGDVTQVDLPRGHASGLAQARTVLDGIRGIAFTHFVSEDIVRHPLVQRIVDAYDRAKT